MKVYISASVKDSSLEPFIECYKNYYFPDVINIVEDCIHKLKSSEITSSAKIMSSSDDYFDLLSAEIKNDIDNEIDSLDIHVDESTDSVVVTVNYMGNIIEFNVPFDDLSMGADIEGDTSYISNTIRYELDSFATGGDV